MRQDRSARWPAQPWAAEARPGAMGAFIQETLIGGLTRKIEKFPTASQREFCLSLPALCQSICTAQGERSPVPGEDEMVGFVIHRRIGQAALVQRHNRFSWPIEEPMQGLLRCLASAC